jgi:hypothetical protein
MGEIAIVPIEQVDIVFEPRPWPFAIERRSEIDRHFAQRCRERPGIWNGRALMLGPYGVVDGVFRGTCFETDYASLLAWRDWKFPDRTVSNFFAAGAVRGSDNAYILGEMGPHTAGAGFKYFPCGTPEPDDLVDGKADLAGNIAREIREETGLKVGDLDIAPGWILVVDRCFRAFIQRLDASEPADRLRARILRHLAGERRPELSAIHIVRAPADFDSRMAPFVTAFLTEAWRTQR